MKGAEAICIEAIVSIHAPREGCDVREDEPAGTLGRFNSRTPGGVRRSAKIDAVVKGAVSIHAPREGCDR